MKIEPGPCVTPENGVGVTDLLSFIPLGQDILTTLRTENAVWKSRNTAYTANELNLQYPSPENYTLNFIVSGVGITEATVVMFSELLDAPNIKKVNFLWTERYFSYTEWMWAQGKTNDISRTFAKEVGKYGKRFELNLVYTRDVNKAPPGTSKFPTGHINGDVMAEAFGLDRDQRPQSPYIKFLSVGSPDFNNGMYGILHSEFNFDIQCPDFDSEWKPGEHLGCRCSWGVDEDPNSDNFGNFKPWPEINGNYEKKGYPYTLPILIKNPTPCAWSGDNLLWKKAEPTPECIKNGGRCPMPVRKHSSLFAKRESATNLAECGNPRYNGPVGPHCDA